MVHEPAWRLAYELVYEIKNKCIFLKKKWYDLMKDSSRLLQIGKGNWKSDK